MEDSYETLVDADIRQEVEGMTATEKAEYLEGNTEVEERMKELSKPSPYLTTSQKDFLYELIKGGAEPKKASMFVSSNSCIDMPTPREIISSQKLISDKEIREQANKELANSFVNSYLSEHPELPTDFRVELHRAASRVEAQVLLRKYELDTIAEAKDEGMRYILEQSQSFDLPIKLRRKIAGSSAKNIDEARAEVSKLIRNFRR